MHDSNRYDIDSLLGNKEKNFEEVINDNQDRVHDMEGSYSIHEPLFDENLSAQQDGVCEDYKKARSSKLKKRDAKRARKSLCTKTSRGSSFKASNSNGVKCFDTKTKSHNSSDLIIKIKSGKNVIMNERVIVEKSKDRSKSKLKKEEKKFTNAQE
jgi:hypothetical protein